MRSMPSSAAPSPPSNPKSSNLNRAERNVKLRRALDFPCVSSALVLSQCLCKSLQESRDQGSRPIRQFNVRSGFPCFPTSLFPCVPASVLSGCKPFTGFLASSTTPRGDVSGGAFAPLSRGIGREFCLPMSAEYYPHVNVSVEVTIMPVFAACLLKKWPLLFFVNQKSFAPVPAAMRNPQYPWAFSRVEKCSSPKNRGFNTRFAKPQLASSSTPQFARFGDGLMDVLGLFLEVIHE
jgi:hypothetical protein